METISKSKTNPGPSSLGKDKMALTKPLNAKTPTPSPTPKSTNKDDKKYQINTVAFQNSVKKAERLAIQNPHGLITYRDLPTPWRINPFILSGYRFTPSLTSAVLSPLLLSNELTNIWTHLLPILIVLRYHLTFDYTSPSTTDDLLAKGYFAAAIISLLCSGAWHSFRCCSRVHVMSAFVSVDIMAVSLILTAFSVVTTYTAFYTQPDVGRVYITSCLTWCVAGLVLPWTDFFRPGEIAPIRIKGRLEERGWKFPTRNWTRVVFFCLLGAQGAVLPSVHATALNGWGYTKEIFGLAAWVVAPMFLGSIVYGAKFPERRWPGRFDYFGNSHNIWHVATAIAAIMGCEVMGGMFEVARKRGSL
jgi:adiponectin receptor